MSIDSDKFRDRIVAEISQDYVDGYAVERHPLPTGLAARFEEVIDANVMRGYRLESWEMARVYYTREAQPKRGLPAEHVINETIVAVFARSGLK